MTNSGPVSSSEAHALAQRIDVSALHGASLAIVGGSGMVGNYFCHALCQVAEIQGYRPKSLSILNRRPASPEQGWAKSFPYVAVSNLQVSFGMEIPSADFFGHFASPASPSHYLSANDVWTANLGPLVSALTGTAVPDRTLFISSGEVYGSHGSFSPSEDDPVNFQSGGTRSWYPNAKIAAEQILSVANASNITRGVSARLFHSFGPGVRRDDGRSFADFLWAAAAGKPIKLYSSGTQVRSFAYLEDTTVGLWIAMTGNHRFTTLNVGGAEVLSVLDFARVVGEVAGVSVGTNNAGEQSVRTESPIEATSPNLARLRNLGWSQKVPLREAVTRTIEFIRRQ